MTELVVPLDDDDWPTLGPQVCAWIEEFLVFGPGDLRGEPARLDDDKRLLIWRMYEVHPRGHRLEGRRRFQRAGVSQAKGTAKTELAAWLAAAELHPDAPVRTVGWDEHDRPIGGGVTDPYIPMIAYTEEQSDELAYGALMTILEASELREDFDIGLERIMRIRGDGKAVSLSGAPNARDGARTTFMVADETHWFTSPRLRQAHQTMLNNLPKRKLADAWALEITTAYEPGSGSVAEATMDYARAVAEGRHKDPRLFFYHREASEHHDLETEEGARAAVIEASGASAAWRNIDAIVDLWRDPSIDRGFWTRVWCNRPVHPTRKAFDVEAFRALERELEVPDGALIVLGFDGSQFRDATAVVATHVATGHQWLAGLWEAPLHAEKWQVPAEEVDACIADLFDRYNIWRLYADPPYWESWVSTWQGRYGDERVIEWWTNRRLQMAAALEAYETAIREGGLSHDGNKDLVRHVGNAHRHELPHRDEQARPRWVIRKDRADSPHKIDAAMAAVLSWEARLDAISSGVSGQVEPMFRRQWLKRWTTRPAGGNRYILVEKKKQSEYTVLWVFELGIDQHYYALDVVRDRLNLAERTELLFYSHREHNPLRVGLEAYSLEADIDHIQDRQARENYRFAIQPLESTLSESERIQRLAPIFEAGRFVLPEKLPKRLHDGSTVDMAEVFVRKEYETYPTAWHTDMLDLASRILDINAVFPMARRAPTRTVFPSDF